MPFSIAWFPHQSFPSSPNFFVLLTKFDSLFDNVLKETEDWDTCHLAKNTVVAFTLWLLLPRQDVQALEVKQD